MPEDIGVFLAFLVLSATALVSAVGVVHSRSVFHAALFLILLFFTIAGLYVTLAADFLAAVQLLVYAGAVGVVVVFAVMLTHRPEQGNAGGPYRVPALLVAVLLGTIIVTTVAQTAWPIGREAVTMNTSAPLGQLLLNNYVLPFEVASVLLLVAMVGAIVLAKED